MMSEARVYKFLKYIKLPLLIFKNNIYLYIEIKYLKYNINNLNRKEFYVNNQLVIY